MTMGERRIRIPYRSEGERLVMDLLCAELVDGQLLRVTD
jgi:hypothetical protein